jgi:hypothetical protein
MRLILERTDEIFASNGGLAVASVLMKSLKIGFFVKKNIIRR